MDRQKFAEIIRSELIRQKLNYTELARRLGASRSWVSNALNQRSGKTVSISTISSFATALGMDMDIFLPEKQTTERFVCPKE